MTQKEIDFCQEHIINFESVKLGFTRNIPHSVLAEYERLYQTYLDPHFGLTYYCSSCVFDMLIRLSNHFDNEKAKTFVFPDDLDTIQPDPNTQPIELKKRGRKPKA
jgi:hypothetical protein